MKRISSLLLLAVLTLPLAAQQRDGDFTLPASALDALSADLLACYDAQQKQDAEVLSFGDYEIRSGPSLWDKEAGKYILPPVADLQRQQFEQQKKKNQVPDGTFIPVRMFFMDSRKGPMAGCPDRLDGSLWVDGYSYSVPDSLTENGKRVLNRKKQSVEGHQVGIFRVENGALVPVMDLGDLSTGSPLLGTSVESAGLWARSKWDKQLWGASALDQWVDLVEPLGEGTEFLKVTTSRVTTDSYVRGEACHYTEHREVKLYDWEGRPALDPPYGEMDPQDLSGYGPVILVQKDSRWGMLDGKSGEALIPCEFESKEGQNPWTDLTSAINLRFRKFSYTIWRDGQAEKDKATIQDYFDWVTPGLGLGSYDVEKEFFPLTLTCTEHLNFAGLKRPAGIPRTIRWRTYSLPVPASEASAFKEAFFDILPEAVSGARFRLVGDLPDLEEITFTLPHGKQYHWRAEE